jgi:hypothetical protein
VKRLVRCFVSQAGTAKQALAKTGSSNASRSKELEPKNLIEKRKRAAGIEPASSAWKAEVLPLNYARAITKLAHHQPQEMNQVGECSPLNSWRLLWPPS